MLIWEALIVFIGGIVSGIFGYTIVRWALEWKRAAKDDYPLNHIKTSQE